VSWLVDAFETSYETAGNDILDTEREVRGQEGEHVDEAAAAAKQAALDLIASGVVGDGDAPIRVSLSGHANPDHEPAEGWANDFVSINIYQL
jgi:hypothetical protein